MRFLQSFVNPLLVEHCSHENSFSFKVIQSPNLAFDPRGMAEPSALSTSSPPPPLSNLQSAVFVSLRVESSSLRPLPFIRCGFTVPGLLGKREQLLRDRLLTVRGWAKYTRGASLIGSLKLQFVCGISCNGLSHGPTWPRGAGP